MTKRFPLSTRPDYESMIAEGYDMSAITSIKQVPALFNRVYEMNLWRPGTVNLDIGGGRFDLATEFLASLGVINLILDPGNRPAEYSRWVLDEIEEHGCDTVTCANILNVIPDPMGRAGVVRTAWDALPLGGVAFFSVYENGKRGYITRKGKTSWQEGRKLITYMPEITPPFTIPLHKPFKQIITAVKQ